MEYWSIGVLEYWSIGVLEYWSTGRRHGGGASKSAALLPAFEIQDHSRGLTGSLPPPPLRWPAAVPPTEDPQSPGASVIRATWAFGASLSPLCGPTSSFNERFSDPSLPMLRSSFTFFRLWTYFRPKSTILEEFLINLSSIFDHFWCALAFEMNFVAKRSDLENIL